jgi:hypothetical protein
MSNRSVIDNMREALLLRAWPTLVLWNRLEGRPRAEEFDRALRAAIRDPLWMLAKQWQLGEFQGDDAGSPVFAKLHLATTRLDKYQPAAHEAQPFSTDVPLEGTVEQRPIPLTMDEKVFSLDLRLMLGRHWLKLLRERVGAGFSDFYIGEYGIEVPVEGDEDQAAILAHPEAWQRFAAVAGRKMDGGDFYLRLKNGVPASQGLGVPDPPSGDIDILGDEFVAWVDQFFLQPHEPEQSAWKPENLEYQFACSAPFGEGERVYEAEEYYTGRLDWFNLSINDEHPPLELPDGEPAADLQSTQTMSFIPVPLDFEGMPNATSTRTRQTCPSSCWSSLPWSMQTTGS